ncbi:hypothetical protein N7509_005360 [Penicillium cosmopolitanum]|uniref:NADH dehydrogenase [ubiquinone] 1 beta subcomplex subunit 9 n=1 Tax=Penicillium cosmopolitanum TaxID=1131564 RepID=A0A9X0BA07_9EURO|nr:uncharacterized protein N7509_005360 [Penicillium cosmopolitanum]KAJ5397247.1 hypothetical protein N7509_005360 [Penicillium cosmopolitanum]
MSLTPALSLYRRSLKLSLDWAVHRSVWRGQAVYIRSLFEANKDVRDPRQQQVLLRETEKILEEWKHPDPYRHPTAPGGTFTPFWTLIFAGWHAPDSNLRWSQETNGREKLARSHSTIRRAPAAH